MGTSTSAIFTGSSQFSNDFQQVVSRAVAIASLPMQQMQSEVTSLQSQSTELSTLNTSFGSLQSAIGKLNAALGAGSFSASSSTSTVASVSLTGTPTAGSFSVEVDDVGSYATAMSGDGLTPVTDPAKASIGDAASYTLTVGPNSYTIAPKDKTLSGLADAINLMGDAHVQATLVNLGTPSQADYRISLQSTRLGDLPIQVAAVDGSQPNQTVIGEYAKSTSNDGLTVVANPAQSNISDATSYTLTVGSKSYSITPGAQTLAALADAINLNTEGNVRATVVNQGSSAQPDHRLSLQGAKLGILPIQLTAADGSNPDQALATSVPAGAPVTYRINGKPVKPASPLTSDTTTITASPGVSITMLAPGTTTVTVGRGTAAVSQALSGLASAYNAAQSEIDKNRGTGTGGLQGQSILTMLSETLHQISGYSTGGDGIASLTTLGLSFDDKGALSFDSGVFATATGGQMAQLTDFLGSTTTGGFLKAANDAVNGLTDSSKGAIQASITSLQGQIAADNQSISDQQDRIDNLQTDLNARMAAADAAISALEQQYSYLSSMFAAMQVNAKNL